jgi:magnesium transporter
MEAAGTAPSIRVLAFGPDALDDAKHVEPAQIATWIGRRPVVWFDVAGLDDAAAIARIGDALGLHRLALEDVVHLDQRPKLEEYGDVSYVVLRMLTTARGTDGEQLSLFLGRGFVATFQETLADGDCLDPVRERIRQGGPRLREGGAGYLAYAILDTVIDAYFPVLEKLGDRIEEIEAKILENPEPGLLPELHLLRRDLLVLRRHIWPLRDVLSSILREEDGPFDASLRVYLRDCHDHAIRLLDFAETYRDIAAGLLELYLTTLSHKLNEVIKVLTVVTTIFIPLSFLAGIWGMNFQPVSPWNMPELSWKYGYPLALGFMAAVGGVMLYFFRRRGWI